MQECFALLCSFLFLNHAFAAFVGQQFFAHRILFVLAKVLQRVLICPLIGLASSTARA